ncbi:MAG: DNA internalization-related competence protein ComEC/Rec2 [Lachnospiraceae bacterium]|nr:DNA internalization-related competence protein ComEC/Rec2 [Lachnospiraceae bacterium]
MRRPFVVMCLLFILALRLYDCVFTPGYGESSVSGQFVYVSGTVSDISVKTTEAYYGASVRYLVTIENVTLQDDAGEANPENWGEIVCYFKEEPQVHIREKVWISGTLQTYSRAQNPGQFDLYQYYYLQGRPGYVTGAELLWQDKEAHPIGDLIRWARNALQKKLSQYFGETYLGVMQAMLLGVKTELDQDIKDLFSASGILHILTISGLHISMLGMGCFKLLRKVGVSPRVSAVCGALMILIYGSLIGLAAATIRAICMFLLQMLAVFLGRTYDMLTGMAVSAVFLLLEQPLYLFYSGFLYSYGAVAGMALVSPLLKRLAEGRRKWFQKAMQIFGAGLGVLAVTLPIQLYYYFVWAPYSVLLNVVIIPLMPVLIGLGMGILCLLPGMAAVLAAWCCERVLDLFFCLCHIASSLPGHSLVTGRPAAWQIFVYYGLIGLFCLLCEVQIEAQNGKLWQRMARWNEKQRVVTRALLATSSLLSACAAVMILFWRSPPDFLCTYLSVGQGDCMVLQTGGSVYIVDCGSSSEDAVAEDILLPYLQYCGISYVDAVFLSHADSDHINGIEQWLSDYVDSGVTLGALILPDCEAAFAEGGFDLILSLALENQISVGYVSAGEEYLLGEVQVTVLSPTPSDTGDENDLSMVLLWEYQGEYLLSTGDISSETEERLVEAYQILSGESLLILKAAHHGSKYSSSSLFLASVSPQYTVLSYGENSYNHPHPDTISRLKEVGTEILYTYLQGAVEVAIKEDGAQVRTFLP